MALVVTSLNGAVALNATLVTLTAHTTPTTSGIGPREFMLVDGEYMQVTDATLTPTLQVTRGALGTLACAHNTLAPVTYGLSSDFTQAVSTDATKGAPMITLSVNNSAQALPVVDATVYITKATALGTTILDPAKDQTNTIKFVSLTAAAHLITFTTSIYGNGASSDVLTFPATVGASFTMCARNGLWQAVATADDGATIG